MDQQPITTTLDLRVDLDGGAAGLSFLLDVASTVDGVQSGVNEYGEPMQLHADRTVRLLLLDEWVAGVATAVDVTHTTAHKERAWLAMRGPYRAVQAAAFPVRPLSSR